MHDMAAYQATRDAFEPADTVQIEYPRVLAEASAYAARGRWATLLERRAAMESDLARLSPYSTQYTSRNIWPFVAYALAMSGDRKGAHALIDKTPVDCSLCLRMRGRLDVRRTGAARITGSPARQRLRPPRRSPFAIGATRCS
jgi:hypothetical protein